MTIKNITEKANIAAVGRILTPGKKITMPVEYYAEKKDFIDNHVTEKRAKLTGMEEYDAFMSGKTSKIIAKTNDKPTIAEEKAKKEAGKIAVNAKVKKDAEEKAKKEAEKIAKATPAKATAAKSPSKE